MSPEKQHKIIQEFFRQAVGEFLFTGGSFDVYGIPRVEIQRFEAMLETPVAEDDMFYSLSQHKSDKCLRKLIRFHALDPASARRFTVVQDFKVTKWRMREATVDTDSDLFISYGKHSHIGTTLRFESLDHFTQIQRIMREIGLCELNDKHLTVVKQRSAPPSQ